MNICPLELSTLTPQRQVAPQNHYGWKISHCKQCFCSNRLLLDTFPEGNRLLPSIAVAESAKIATVETKILA
jgi:hypothetical protein